MFKRITAGAGMALAALTQSLGYTGYRHTRKYIPSNHRLPSDQQAEIMRKAQAKRDRRANRGW